MNSPLLQLLVLAGIAVFLILRLKSVLGTREGFEQPPVPRSPDGSSTARRDFEVIDGGPDHDIEDHVDAGSDAAAALAGMKRAEPSFVLGEFIQGARGAYEMILMGFERGELADIKAFLSDEVYETFAEVVESRDEQGLTIEAEFIGVRETAVLDATFDDSDGYGEVTMRFVGELTVVVRDSAGEIIEGSATSVKKQKDVWTFGRTMGVDDPNWLLVATGE
ncbi:Tim44/TimA family putative adaptor protein [Roseobacteraceae bacterium S113]